MKAAAGDHKRPVEAPPAGTGLPHLVNIVLSGEKYIKKPEGAKTSNQARYSRQHLRPMAD